MCNLQKQIGMSQQKNLGLGNEIDRNLLNDYLDKCQIIFVPPSMTLGEYELLGI